MTYKENEVIDNVRLNKYPRNDAFLFDIVADTRQKSLDHEINVRVTYKQYEVTVALLFYVHGKHLRSCRDGQLT